MKRMIDLTSERKAIGAISPDERVIRVRRITEYGGIPHYEIDGWPLPVPAWMRHLDGRSVQGVVLALALVSVFACVMALAGWRLLFGAK